MNERDPFQLRRNLDKTDNQSTIGSTPFVDIDDLISERNCDSESAYASALSDAQLRLQRLQFQNFSDSERVTELETIIKLLSNACGRFHLDLYKARGVLLGDYIVVGDMVGAYKQCAELVCALVVMYQLTPYHPLLGLQLFTLGDLAAAVDNPAAVDIYTWAREILIVTHGDASRSELVKRLDAILNI